MLCKNGIIYQLLDSRSTGGIETHVFNLSYWLVQQGYKCEVLLLKDYGTHPLKKQMSKAGIPWRTLKGVAELNHLLKKTKCLLATHGYKAGILGRILAKLNNLAVISTYHSGDRGTGKLRCYSAIDECSSRLADNIICVSSEIAARLPVPSNLVPNFVEVPSTTSFKGNKIAFVGRLSIEKGPDTFAKICKDFSCFTPIYVFGEGPMLDSLSNAYPTINWCGNVDMQEQWEEIGLLCITSRSEGLPLVALEAMARGIPVISYALGGIPQLIEHRKNGWLVNPGDTQKFSSTIEQWLNLSTKDKKAMSISAYQLIKSTYSSDIVGPQILSSYQRALQRVSQ
jgi:glycosyltransferase involved in cell wall biosynthesis